jgi:hypothetical protein
MSALTDPEDFRPVIIEVIDGVEVEIPVAEWWQRQNAT